MATTVVTAKFVADTSDLQGKLSGVQGQLEKTSNRMKATGESVAAMGRQMTMATAPIVAFGAIATKAFVDFDNKMTQSLAIMSGVTSEMRAEMEATARTVSTTFGIAADKAAESYFFLASAGLDAEQSMAALPQVAAFAKAGMFDMATATDLATDAQSALGLTVKEASQNLENLTRVTDVLVRANTLANATVEQFSIALTTKAGAALKSVNKDVEEGVAVLAALADQGIKAQLAGNQLAIVMRDLQTKAIENKDTFAEYGLEVFDTEGKMKNLGEIIANLERVTAGMSDEQKRATLGLMGFSDRSLSAMTALFGTSEAIMRYEQELRNAGGTTADVAENQMQSMAAQIELLKAQFMDLALGVGEVVVSRFLTPLVELLSRAAKAFSAIPEPIRNMAISLGLVVALAGPLMWMTGAAIKGVGAMGVAFAAANAKVIAYASRAVVAFKAVGAGAGTMALHVGAALTSKKVAMEVGVLAARKFAAGTVLAFRTIGAAARGLMAALGPIGIALIAAGAAFEFFSGRSAAADALVQTLKDSVDELTGAFGEATAAAMSAQFRLDLSPEDVQALADMGISISDMTQAAMLGGEAAEQMSAKMQGLIDSAGFFSGERDLLITAQRNFGGMVQASDEARVKVEADAAARADALAIEGQKAKAELERQIADSRGQAIQRQQDLANMTAAERRALEERKRAADAAIAKDNALVAVTQAAKDAVTALEVAMSNLNGVIGNQNSRNAAIRSTRDLSKALDENGKKIKGTSEAAMANQDAIANSASAWIRYAQATDDPIKQQERLKRGEKEIRAALEERGIDPNQSPIVKQFQTQLEKSQETVDEFKKRATEARGHGLDTGRNFIQGILEELRAGASKVHDESVAVGEAMPDGVDEGTRSSSPSLEGMRNAKNFIDGIIKGLKADKVMEKASDLGKAMVAAFEEEIQRISDVVESALDSAMDLADMVAKPFGTASKIMQNFGRTAGISSLVSGFSDLRGSIVGAYAPLLDKGIVGSKAAKRNRQQMNAQIGMLQNLTQHGINLRNEYQANLDEMSRLEAAYEVQVAEINSHFDALEAAAQANIQRIESYWNGVISGLQNALRRANEAYAKENGVLQDLIKARDGFLNRISSGFRSFVNDLKFAAGSSSKTIQREMKKLANGITVTLEREIEVGGSPQNIAAALDARLASVREFSQNIRTLMARGLDPTLVEDFVSAGVSGAGEAAAALVQASDGELQAINQTQAALAAEVASFQQYASEQWHDAGIAQQEAVVAPLRAAAEAAQAALDMANASREAELAAARAHLEQLRKDREAALAAAAAAHKQEMDRLAAENLRLEDEMDQTAVAIETMIGDIAMTLPPKAFAAGQKSMRQLRAGFEERFPAVSKALNRLMDTLAASMNREARITIKTVYETVGAPASAMIPGRAKGGPVQARQAYIVGEKGPELFMSSQAGNIIPNHKLGSVPSMGSRTAPGGSTVINLNVNAGMGADGAEVGRQVVEAIRKYERRSGPVFVSAS
jgi:TP901 family phage tail tape measure protein